MYPAACACAAARRLARWAFEVLFKGTPRDPVHYLFASLSPEDYAHMVYMATATSQALD